MQAFRVDKYRWVFKFLPRANWDEDAKLGEGERGGEGGRGTGRGRGEGEGERGGGEGNARARHCQKWRAVKVVPWALYIQRRPPTWGARMHPFYPTTGTPPTFISTLNIPPPPPPPTTDTHTHTHTHSRTPRWLSWTEPRHHQKMKKKNRVAVILVRPWLWRLLYRCFSSGKAHSPCLWDPSKSSWSQSQTDRVPEAGAGDRETVAVVLQGVGKLLQCQWFPRRLRRQRPDSDAGPGWEQRVWRLRRQKLET